MFIYKGRRLDISKEKLEEYAHWIGLPLRERTIDTYLHLEYHDTSADPLSIGDKMDDETLTGFVIDHMDHDLSFHR